MCICSSEDSEIKYQFKAPDYISGFSFRAESVSTSLVAQTAKRLPTTRESLVQSLGQEDLLEKEMATHSSILAWKIPWMEEPGRLTVHGIAKSWT